MPDLLAAFALTSAAFDHKAPIPKIHTCQGKNISPPLAWTGTPPGTQSLVLIVDDPDAPDPLAPTMTWVHWVLYDIPAEATQLDKGVWAQELPPGTRQGLNDWHRTGYGGPCPPTGEHRYFFKLYALDTRLPDLHEPTKVQLEHAMFGHILARAELIGTYRKH